MRRTAWGILAALGAIAVVAGALIPFRSSLGEAMTALVLVLPVIVGVVVGGLWAGVVSVFAGFFVYVYFFVPPYLTTSIGSMQNWVALGVYMALTLPVAYVVDRMHAARSIERRQAEEIRQLLELSELLVEDRPLDELLSTVVAAMCSSFDARQVAILLPGPDGLEVAAAAGNPVGTAQRRVLAHAWLDGTGPPGDTGTIALSAAGRPIGLLALDPAAGAVRDREALQLFATQIALAVERMQLREEAIRTRLDAQVDRLATMLVTAVSHDLRTPLASIKASSSVLADDRLDIGTPDARRLARLVDLQADRLAELVQDLLDMSRIRAGVLRPRCRDVAVGDLVDSVVEELGTVLAGVVVEVDAPDDLPPVTVDPTLIERVLANLLANAARHAPRGTAVLVAARRSGSGVVELSVSDHGLGVGAERHADLFGLAARRDADSGAGLGLIIARTFVEAHGQSIWVDGSPVGGARFCFTLPASPLVGGRTAVAADPRH
jgi:two-component system, OmpR family, sensor histidine kinase KdpD